VISIVDCCHSAKFAHMPLGISDRNNIILHIAEKSDYYDLDLVFSLVLRVRVCVRKRKIIEI